MIFFQIKVKCIYFIIDDEYQYNCEYDDIKKAMEFSVNETINAMKKNLPDEPTENKPFLTIHFIQKDTEKIFSRKFNPNDKIKVKLFNNYKLIFIHVGYD